MTPGKPKKEDNSFRNILEQKIYLLYEHYFVRTSQIAQFKRKVVIDGFSQCM